MDNRNRTGTGEVWREHTAAPAEPDACSDGARADHAMIHGNEG